MDKLKHQEGIRLSLLTAPAGFGKTTAVIQSIKELNSGQDQRSSNVAWLSLDEHDNTLAAFVSYFIGAVQQVEQKFAEDLQISISSGQQPDAAFVARELINQFADLKTPLHFVLDDFQVINDPEITALMNLVVEYLPPQIHLMIASRKPVAFDLSRWRGRGWLNEVDAKHLRFTLEETEAFLYHTMQLAENVELVPALHDQTGGWAVGLHLAAYAIREHEDFRVFLAGFGGGTKYISDYLMAEVFTRQSPQIQDFLLKTSIADKFTAGLCAAIVNIDLHLAHGMLEKLEKSDLFFITLDDEGHWFQYHKLFLAFLEKQRRKKLDAESISGLHANAAQWYGDQQFIVKAVDHCLIAKKYDEAVRWMQGIAFEQVWEQSVGGEFVSWIPQFPPAMLKNHPQLVVAAAGAFLIRGEWPLLNEMLQILQDCEETENEYRLYSGVLLRSTDQEGALELFHQVVNATAIENVYHQFARSQMALVLREMGELKQATEMLSDFNKQYVRIGIPQKIIWLQIINILSDMHYVQGQLGKAEAVLTQAFDYLSQARYPTPLVGMLHNSQGRICWARHELDAAKKHFTEALRWGQLSGMTDILHLAYKGLSDVMLARYDAAALKHLEAGYQVFRRAGSHGFNQPMLGAHKALAHLNLDDAPAALRWAEGSGLTPEDLPLFQNHARYQIYAAVKLRTYAAANDKEGMVSLLPLVERLQQQAQVTNHAHHHLNCLIARAIIYAHQDADESLAALYEAMDLYEKTGLLGVLLMWKVPLRDLLMNAMPAVRHGESMRQVLLALSNLPGMENTKRTNLDENKISLTNREMEILTLIALGMTNKEIAEQLVISENTLRTHVRNLYRKLGVKNRTQAVKAGQDHGLI